MEENKSQTESLSEQLSQKEKHNYKYISFTVFIIVINILISISIISVNSTEAMGYLVWTYFLPSLALYIIFVSKTISSYRKHRFTKYSLIITFVTIASIAATLTLYQYASSTLYFIEKNSGEEKVFEKGTLVGENLQYYHAEYGLTFTYPKDWNLVVEKLDLEKVNASNNRIGERIYITPRNRGEINWGGDKLSGITISPSRNAPFTLTKESLQQNTIVNMGGEEIAETLEDIRRMPDTSSRKYLGEEIIGGKSFPYFENGISYSFDKGTMIDKLYFFAHKGILFTATYSISSEEKIFESLLHNIIKNMK